jgi:hypothetical protein
MRHAHAWLDANADGDRHLSFINQTIKMLLSGRIPRPMVNKKIIKDSPDSSRAIKTWKDDFLPKIEETCRELRIDPIYCFFDFAESRISKIKSSYQLGESIPDDVTEEAINIITEGQCRLLVQDKSSLLQYVNSKVLINFFIFMNPIALEKANVKYEDAERLLKRKISTEIMEL